MKKSDLINLIIRYLEKSLSINETCRSGATQESKFFEFRGDFPQLSQFKPDPTSLKAARIIGVVLMKEEKLAFEAFRQLPIRAQEIVILHPLACRKHNPSTGSPYNHFDCAQLLGISFSAYLDIRKKALRAIQVIFEKNTISSA